MTLRDWTDPRDGRHWRVRQTGLPTVLVFASEDDLFSVVIDFNDKLEDRSDAELERLLNEGRGAREAGRGAGGVVIRRLEESDLIKKRDPVCNS